MNSKTYLPSSSSPASLISTFRLAALLAIGATTALADNTQSSDSSSKSSNSDNSNQAVSQAQNGSDSKSKSTGSDNNGSVGNSSQNSGDSSFKSTGSDNNNSGDNSSQKSGGSDGKSSDSENNKPIVSSIQSAARPDGLSIVAKVNVAGSDAASAKFQTTALPSITDFITKNLPEYTRFDKASSFALDPSKLRMSVESSARVYFVSEGAGYHNTLGFNTLAAGAATPTTALTKSASLIFPDVSSTVSTYNPAPKAQRTSNEPLLPGDFVDLGTFKVGSMLDFFLVSNGANGGQNVWTDSVKRNSDGIQHMVAFSSPNSPYLVMSFEDLAGGGDRDYNDVVFAVDIGAINVKRLLSTPEPASWALAISLGAVALFWRRRMVAA